MTHQQLQTLPDTLKKPCPECGESGECTTSHRYTCPDCKGHGKVPVPGLEDYLRSLSKEPARGDDRTDRR